MGEIDEKEGEERGKEKRGRWRAEEHLQSCMQIKGE